jgi:hypothetical protein
MEYNIPNLSELLVQKIEIKNSLTHEYETDTIFDQKIHFIEDLKIILPFCKYYEIDIIKFILIAYNNIITQLIIIIENDELNILHNINLKHLHYSNNIKKEFYKLFIIEYNIQLPSNIIKNNHNKKYSDVLKNTAKSIHRKLCLLAKNNRINMYFNL